MTTVTITIDGREVKAQAGQTVLDAATAAGFDIPVLCHHPAVEPIGACRMCLVEIEKQRALQPACTFPVSGGLVIHTESPKVVDSRKFILNLLFSERNHFCMYCQMSGNCELQDLAYRYEMDHWLYERAYPDLQVDSSRDYFVMDHGRCVLCRRCTRACGELVGNHTLGLQHRGVHTMLVADLDVPFGESSCVSCGTCLQVCPTGALMDRTSAYGGTKEEVSRVKTACQFCSVGCTFEIIVRVNHVIRLEGDWDGVGNKGLLCVKGRFEPLFDRRERVTAPMVSRDGELVEVTWDEALQVVADRAKPFDGNSAALVSTRVTNEAAALFAKVFGTGDNVGSMIPLPKTLKEVESDLAALEDADLFVVVGADLGDDHQVAGFAVKRGVTNKGARLVLVGEGESEFASLALAELKPAEVGAAVALAQGASMPVVIYGAGAGEELATLRDKLAGKAQFVGLVAGANARGLQAAGLTQAADLSGAKFVYALVSDDGVSGKMAKAMNDADFVVLQASYMTPLTESVDVILPSAIWSERSGTITNTEGRERAVVAALTPLGESRADDMILKELAAKLGVSV
jgi:formate dehydrogenase major subunit